MENKPPINAEPNLLTRPPTTSNRSRNFTSEYPSTLTILSRLPLTPAQDFTRRVDPALNSPAIDDKAMRDPASTSPTMTSPASTSPAMTSPVVNSPGDTPSTTPSTPNPALASTTPPPPSKTPTNPFFISAISSRANIPLPNPSKVVNTTRPPLPTPSEAATAAAALPKAKGSGMPKEPGSNARSRPSVPSSFYPYNMPFSTPSVPSASSADVVVVASDFSDGVEGVFGEGEVDLLKEMGEGEVEGEGEGQEGEKGKDEGKQEGEAKGETRDEIKAEDEVHKTPSSSSSGIPASSTSTPSTSPPPAQSSSTSPTSTLAIQRAMRTALSSSSNHHTPTRSDQESDQERSISLNQLKTDLRSTTLGLQNTASSHSSKRRKGPIVEVPDEGRMRMEEVKKDGVGVRDFAFE